MEAVKMVSMRYPHVMVAYYAQDFEQWFWNSPFTPLTTSISQKRHYKEAFDSYSSRNGRVFIFAKTKWTADMITANHKVKVRMVQPSMNHDIHFPDPVFMSRRNLNKMIRIVAMVRPQTGRRNPLATMEVLLRLISTYGQRIRVTVYGCAEEVLKTAMEALRNKMGPAHHRDTIILASSSFDFVGVVKDRKIMASMFRKNDIFIDLSWWQAFGRSCMEAMASGCVAVFPDIGAGREICGVDERNCLYHNGSDIDGYYSKIVSVINDEARFKELVVNGIERTRDFTVDVAAASIATALKRGLRNFRKNKALS